jgi:hypothetical protein
MLIACPQTLHVIKVPPAMFLVVVYIPQGYASVASSDEGIGTAPNEANYQSKGELIAGIPEDIV